MKFQNIDSEFLPTSSSFIVKVIHRTSTLLTKNTAIQFSSITDLNVVEWRVVSGIHFFGTATQKMLVEYTGGDQAQTSWSVLGLLLCIQPTFFVLQYQRNGCPKQLAIQQHLSL